MIRVLHDRRICIRLGLLCYVTSVCSPHAHNFFTSTLEKQADLFLWSPATILPCSLGTANIIHSKEQAGGLYIMLVNIESYHSDHIPQ
jgi:hypothetical protein